MITKNFLIVEIGLNHLGSLKNLRKFLNKLNKSDIEAVSIQILSHSFFKKNKLEKYYIKREVLIKYFIENCKKKIGVIIDDLDESILKYLNKISFFKVLGNQLQNKELINKLKNINKKIYLSNRGLNKKKNNDLINIIKSKSNLNYIHTQLKADRKFANLERLKLLKTRKGLSNRISFGHHCNDIRILYESVLYSPNEIFFYVKGNKSKIKYLDDTHAIHLNNLDNVVKNIRFLNYNLKKYKVI